VCDSNHYGYDCSQSKCFDLLSIIIFTHL
jgi:hypothetical protein